jgi:RND superfamily putative drug exporter
VEALRQAGEVPPGLDVALTGSAVVGRDLRQAGRQSAAATERWTVLLVVALLLLLYRAPFLALIPLATVFVATQAALAYLRVLAGAGAIGLFEGIQSYVTVLGYGAGVDYALFLIARYQEELGGGQAPRAAVAGALGKVGPALVASAATVMGGVGMMAFAEFGKFRQAGVAVFLSLALVLAAALTFTPALLCLAGRWAVWPRRVGAAPARLLPGLWEGLGRLLLRRPATIWLASVALLAPLAAVGVWASDRLTYDLLANLPAEAAGVRGQRALQRHFPAGLSGPVTVLVAHDEARFLVPLPKAAQERPLLGILLQGFARAFGLPVGGDPAGEDVAAIFTDYLADRRQELGLAEIRTVAAPLGVTGTVTLRLPLPSFLEELLRWLVRLKAYNYYVAPSGHVTRLDLVPEGDAFTPEAIAGLAGLEEAVRAGLPAHFRSGARLFVLGPTASIRDVKAVTDRDQVRIMVLVVGCVFVVLVVLLRRPGICLYLLASVFFSYLATLGLTAVVFGALDPAGFRGLDWKLPLFLFTILIAVGEDYNIFLMARVKEEEPARGPTGAVVEALARTGQIITSCGLIMAGTFASLLAGSLAGMRQLGFALAVGVLLDTFVVRTVLVPAFLIWLGRRRERPVPQGQAVSDRARPTPAISPN